MFNLFYNYKTHLLVIALISLACYCCALKYRNLKLLNNILTLQNKAAEYEAAMSVANAKQEAQQKEMQLTEQDAAKAQAESNTRKDSIMSTPVSEDCNQSKEWLIQQALKFNWNN